MLTELICSSHSSLPVAASLIVMGSKANVGLCPTADCRCHKLGSQKKLVLARGFPSEEALSRNLFLPTYYSETNRNENGGETEILTNFAASFGFIPRSLYSLLGTPQRSCTLTGTFQKHRSCSAVDNAVTASFMSRWVGRRLRFYCYCCSQH